MRGVDTGHRCRPCVWGTVVCVDVDVRGMSARGMVAGVTMTL